MRAVKRRLSWLGAILAIAAFCGQAVAAQDSEVKTSGTRSVEKGAEAGSIKPADYVRMLGKGLDVDWAKTPEGMAAYHASAVADLKKMGFSHARVRVKDDVTEGLLQRIETIVKDCLAQGLIPVVAYQGDAFKTEPTDGNMQAVVSWWGTVAERLKNCPPRLSFDSLIEVTDALNKDSDKINQLYEKVVAEIRKTNPERIIFISPRLRSDPAYLNELKIPTKHNGFLMAEWHFYASGPSKTNPNKLWTTGAEEEKELIRAKIRQALDWQSKTGIPTWVGAWMPNDYNKGDNYTLDEQIKFARFVAGELDKAGVPFSVNSDSKYYDRENRKWIEENLPLVHEILKPSNHN